MLGPVIGDEFLKSKLTTLTLGVSSPVADVINGIVWCNSLLLHIDLVLDDGSLPLGSRRELESLRNDTVRRSTRLRRELTSVLKEERELAFCEIAESWDGRYAAADWRDGIQELRPNVLIRMLWRHLLMPAAVLYEALAEKRVEAVDAVDLNNAAIYERMCKALRKRVHEWMRRQDDWRIKRNIPAHLPEFQEGKKTLAQLDILYQAILKARAAMDGPMAD